MRKTCSRVFDVTLPWKDRTIASSALPPRAQGSPKRPRALKRVLPRSAIPLCVLSLSSLVNSPADFEVVRHILLWGADPHSVAQIHHMTRPYVTHRSGHPQEMTIHACCFDALYKVDDAFFDDVFRPEEHTWIEISLAIGKGIGCGRKAGAWSPGRQNCCRFC